MPQIAQSWKCAECGSNSVVSTPYCTRCGEQSAAPPLRKAPRPKPAAPAVFVVLLLSPVLLALAVFLVYWVLRR